MKNNIDPMIESIKRINKNTKMVEGDDELFFTGGFFKRAELFLGGFNFLVLFVVL
jgi:hypothetical protein